MPAPPSIVTLAFRSSSTIFPSIFSRPILSVLIVSVSSPPPRLIVAFSNTFAVVSRVTSSLPSPVLIDFAMVPLIFRVSTAAEPSNAPSVLPLFTVTSVYAFLAPEVDTLSDATS